MVPLRAAEQAACTRGGLHHHRENSQPSDTDDDHWDGRVYSAGYRRIPVTVMFLDICCFGGVLVVFWCLAGGFSGFECSINHKFIYIYMG